MRRTIIKNANIISEGKIFESDILIEDFFISKISKSISPNFPNTKIIDGLNKTFLWYYNNQRYFNNLRKKDIIKR